MERFEALKRLRKMLGKEFAYEYRPDAPSEDEREAAKQAKPALTAAHDAARKALAARHQELLQGDAEYQRLRQVEKEARDAASKNAGILMLHKFTVGTANKLFFHVKAQGNSWEDIFAKLKAEKS